MSHTPTPRAYTSEELRNNVLNHVRLMVEYWATLPGLDERSRCDGVAFSILTMIDGSADQPPMALVALSSDEDKKYSVEKGENWVEHGTVINDDVMLHEEYNSPEREEYARNVMAQANLTGKKSDPEADAQS